MKTRYKYIHFKLLEQSKKYQRWVIANNRNGKWLGFIEWYPAWKEYCFCPEHGTVFNDSCLADIIDFIGQLEAK